MTDTLIQILALPKLEDAVIDWLLTQPQQLVFETSKVQQYGQELNSLTERVTGFRQQVLFTLQLPASSVSDFLRGIQQDFSTQLHAGNMSYRAWPLAASQHDCQPT